MSLLEYAKKELSLAGLYDSDSDYHGLVARAVEQLVNVFSAQGHSGLSANIVLYLFNEVAHYRPLTDLTNDPSEWNQVDKEMWQSSRRPDAFSRDGGKTYYLLDDNPRVVYEAKANQ